MKETQNKKAQVLYYLWSLIFSVSLIPLSAQLCSCTQSFQTICTDGTASDIVDETLKNDVETTPTVNASVVPKKN